MGVTLERVQNKFACIIGELCGEPKILSQFAIWVDLRLAEYKSKGSISLECSGSVPEPSWLEGLTPSPQTLSQNPSSSFSRPTSTYAGAPAPHSHTGNLTDKSADVVVKTESSGDDSFAYLRQCAGFDTGDQLSTERASNARKRTFAHASASYNVGAESVADTCRIRQPGPPGHNEHVNLSSPVKRFRRSSSSSTVVPVSQVDVDCPDVAILPSPHANTSMGEGSLLTANGGERPGIISILAEEAFTGDLYNSRESISSAAHGFRQSYDNQDVEWARKEAGGSYERLGSQWLSPLHTPMIMERSRSNCQTAKNIQSAATTFERWLAVKEKSNRRPMEHIPPAELDKYLTDFFSTVKKRSGQDYNSDTLLSLRSYIDRYLREKGYPCSITKSDVFANSQVAFKVRRQELAGGGTHLRSPSFGHLANGIPLSPNTLGANKNGGMGLPLPSTDSSSGSISNVPRNSLSHLISSPEADSLSEGNSISQINNSYRQPDLQHTSEDNVDPSSKSDTGKSFMTTSHTEPSKSGTPDQVNVMDSTGVVPATRSVCSEKRSSSSPGESRSPSSEISSPIDVVQVLPYRALSDSSRSSHNTETPSSPLSFFSDLPKMPQTLAQTTPQTLPRGLQEEQQ
ncbi:uncharacterized protein LOC135463418 [Liolophura sinensis]|uniref:uncharacterized protein LOC135463418 n=1 Tax=Liolophura sinensis TaxID=3198878 RepID=UPI0031582ED6